MEDDMNSPDEAGSNKDNAPDKDLSQTNEHSANDNQDMHKADATPNIGDNDNNVSMNNDVSVDDSNEATDEEKISDFSFLKKKKHAEHVDNKSEHSREHHDQHAYHNKNAAQHNKEHHVHHKEHEQHKEAEEDDEGMKLDFSGIKKLFNTKAFGIILTILLILIPVILTIYIRVLPQSLPATDSWAQSSVENYYRSNIAQQVNAQYPNLPQQSKNTLIDQQYAQFKSTNKDQITQQIQQTSEYFKTGFRYEENNHTYTFLGDLDSYFWLRQARNLEAKGMTCDEIRNGTICWDNHMLAPIGAPSSPSLHAYGIRLLHRILDVFVPSVNIMQASFFLPTILAVLAAIAAFFIGRRLMNDTAGFFAAMFIALSPILITRSLGSDNDIWNITLPLIIVWMFLEAFESKDIIRRVIFSVAAGIFAGIFSFAWSGWWYIFDFIIAALIAYILFEVLRKYLKHRNVKETLKLNTDIKNGLLVLGILIVFTAIFVTVFTSFGGFLGFVTQPLDFSSSLKVAANLDLWPNVLTTVAELNAASISTIVGQLSFGINILFGLMLLGIVFMLVKKKPDAKEYWLIGFSILLYIYMITPGGMSMNPFVYLVLICIPVIIALFMLLKTENIEIDIKTSFLLIIWVVGMIYVSIKGVRFILLLTPVFALSLGVSMGYIYQYFQRVFKENLKMSINISKVLAFIILCLILITPLKVGIDAGRSFVPSMTKGWWDSLTKIRLESAPDAIINSWWDFGHWFKYVADRRVSFDGASQTHPNAHWMGLVLQTPDENRSVALLKMMDCGSNNAFEEINKKYKDTEKSENVVSDIVVLSRADAKSELLKLGFSNDEAETILQYTHCSPPEDYFITSEDMIGKSGVWGHFGLWSFDKAYIVNNLKNMNVNDAVKIMKDRWNYTDDEASRIYYDVQALQSDQDENNWIAPWPSYGGGRLTSCTPDFGPANSGNISLNGSVNPILQTPISVTCNLNLGVGNSNGGTVVIEKAIVNLTSPEDSYVQIGFYDQNNQRVQAGLGAFSELAIYDKDIKKYTLKNSTVGLAMLLNIDRQGNQTTYQTLLADPLLIDSTFTKLFFLDGKGMSHFEKFSDVTDITGQRIIVWKVKW